MWRGLSYAFCYHHTPPGHLSASEEMLPAWARATLASHADDPRMEVSRQDLDRGASGDAVWDALMKSLIKTGELHNNARMGWGKAVIKWTPASGALSALMALNDRFAVTRQGRNGCDGYSCCNTAWS